MLTSKQRAEYRAQANGLDVTLMVGKGGVSDQLIAEAEKVLEAKELVKGRVLESALLTAREASDAICEATGADGISTAGATFVIWRRSQKLEEAQKAREKVAVKKKVNPVRAGRQRRKAQAKAERERKAQYFHDEAVKAAIERRKQFYQD